MAPQRKLRGFLHLLYFEDDAELYIGNIMTGFGVEAKCRCHKIGCADKNSRNADHGIMRIIRIVELIMVKAQTRGKAAVSV